MRQITVKYAGECAKCGTGLEIGAAAMYEKTTGIFCKGCEPTDTEEIRAYRQERGSAKADRLDSWAEKREVQAAADLNSFPEIRHDIAFITQPGRIPFRDRMNAADARACESLNKAARMRERAESLRNVQVKGDAEKRWQGMRDFNDGRIKKGDRVFEPIAGFGVVVGVFKNSYRIKYERGFTHATDKAFVKPAPADAQETITA